MPSATHLPLSITTRWHLSLSYRSLPPPSATHASPIRLRQSSCVSHPISEQPSFALRDLVMNTRLLRLSALITLAYGLGTSTAYAESCLQKITGSIPDTQGQSIANPEVAQEDSTKNANNKNGHPSPICAASDNDVETSDGATTVALPTIIISSQHLNQARNGILVETGSSAYHISQQDIAALPQGENTSFNQLLLQAPGVAQDSFGQLHVRGDHANLQYRLNGIILPESISGFGQTLDTRFVENVSVLTGALPAQYGYRTAGVVDIHTKTGEQVDGGDIGVQIGSNNTRQISGDVSGSTDRFSYYINGSFEANNLGIENPVGTSTALHDRTLQNKGFGYFSYMLDADTRVSLILG